MKETLMVLVLLLILVAMPYRSSDAGRMGHLLEYKRLHAVRVLNATTICRGKSVKIFTIIDNPETWTLHNISCFFIIRPAKGVEIVRWINVSGAYTDYRLEGEEFANITMRIDLVGMKSKFIHWVVVRFRSNGTSVSYTHLTLPTTERV